MSRIRQRVWDGQTRHVVVDLETLGVGPRARIVSIGAVAFLGAGGPADSFYSLVDLDDPLNLAREEDPETVAWWARQDKPARKALEAAENRVHLETALRLFALWAAPAWCPRENVVAWGNGAEFDLAILADAYAQVRVARGLPEDRELREPWDYWNGQSLRTIAALFPEVPAGRFEGVKHHALHDAQHEARHLRALLRAWERVRVAV